MENDFLSTLFNVLFHDERLWIQSLVFPQLLWTLLSLAGSPSSPQPFNISDHGPVLRAHLLC